MDKLKSMMMILLIFVCLTVGCIESSNGQLLVHNLGGNDWLAYNQDRSTNTLSVVPGSIYTDLIKGGVLNGGDVYQEYNDIAYRWVAYDNWTFIKKFDVDETVLQYGEIYLTCHGLDTIGNVTLNGKVLGLVDNMFVRYKWPIKGILKQKDNVIEINFVSATTCAKKLAKQTSYPVPPVALPLIRNPEIFVQFLRKMQASFSWDWGPAFPTQGIWRPIGIEAYNVFLLRNILVDTKPIDSGHTHWTLNTTLWIETILIEPLKGNVTLYLDGNFLIEEAFDLQGSVGSEFPLSLQFSIPDIISISPWFPNGVSGGKQVLYNLTAKISTQHQSISKSVKIGFRTIELVQEKLPVRSESYSFYFKVNGQPIYSKGANWIPAHILQEALTDGYIENLLMSAKLANMNMIRVWGGGVYESDWFYELCDKFGILVWQDMMFASANYPTDYKFVSSVTTEITQQIRRLQHHPSIVIWSGNSDCQQNMASGLWTELLQYRVQLRKGYIDLFVQTVYSVMAKEDLTRPVLTSSSSNGILNSNHGYLAPQVNQYGDYHFFIGSGNAWNWKRYPSAKFVSEYGFQSLLSSTTLRQYVHHQYFQYPLLDQVARRQHTDENGNDNLIKLIGENLPLPENGGTNRFDDFVYLTQVFQAMSTKIETEFYRRNRKISENGDGFTLGALYYTLNEAWPGFSMSSLEYGGKWKIAHYYLAKIFDNYLVDIYEDGDYTNVVIVCDNIQENINFDVHVEIYDWSNQRAINSFNFITTTKPFDANLVYQKTTSELLNNAKCQDRNRCFIKVTIHSKSHPADITRDNFLLLNPIKNAIGLERPEIQIRDIFGPIVDDLGFNVFRVELQTDRIAPFVYMDIDNGNSYHSNVSGIFSDNGFILVDLINISFKTFNKISSEDLKKLIVIRSLKDVNHN